jgi:TP901 family phage tail tape measure protein
MSTKRFAAQITIGGAITGALKSALGTTKDKLTEIGGAVRKLEREQRMLGNSIGTFSTMGKNVDGLRARYAAVTAEIEKTRKAQEKLKSATAMSNKGGAMMASAGLTIGAVAAAASTAFVPVIQAAAFEKAMLGVAKQVEGARDENGKLTATYFDMAKQVQLLGREIPLATNELADMVAAGARMGIAKDQLIDFTKTSAMMASAFELPAGELAMQMGKIADLFKIPITNISELADAINYLDDETKSTAPGLIDFLTRTGGVAGSIKITGKEMAALGSTLLSLGERSETAGTAVNAMVQKFAAADKGTKKFKQAMSEIGLSTAAVQKGMQVDAQGTMLKVLDAVGKMPAEKRLGILVDLVGLEHSDTLAKLAGNVEEYRRQIDLANSQKAMGSMSREFQAQLATTSAQWEITKNVVGEVAVNIGSVLLPAVNSALITFGKATSAVADFVGEHRTLVGNVAAAAAGIGAAVASWQSLVFAFGVGMKVIGSAMLSNPVGLLAIGIGAAAALIYKNWDSIVAGATWVGESIKKAVGSAIEWVMQKIGYLGEVWAKAKAFFGFGGDTKVIAGSTQPANAPPPVPAMRNGAVSGPTYNTTNAQQITIHQQPGQNSKELADEVARRLKEREGVQRRGMMYDHAMGY